MTEGHGMGGHMPGKAASRVILGDWLRRLRDRKGIGSDDAALEAGVARATLWRLENGDSRCRYKPGDVEILGRLYGAERATIETLIRLTKQTRMAGWLDDYRDVLTDNQATYLDLEAYAVRVRCYVNAVLPDLLQVTTYTDALLAASRSLGASQTRRLTRLRTARQQLLTRDPQPARFEFLIDEAVLHRSVHASAMLHQLRDLPHRADLPHVTVRVVPYRAGLYPGLDVGAFTLLDFPTDETFGAVESVSGDEAFGCLPSRVYRLGEDTLLHGGSDVDTYDDHWSDIRAHALDRHASLRLITDTAENTAAALSLDAALGSVGPMASALAIGATPTSTSALGDGEPVAAEQANSDSSSDSQEEGPFG